MISETVNDSLTGLKSRKYFFDNAGFLLKVAQREKKPVSMVMMDINKFKEINDKYGHLAGDKVLKNVGGVINNCVRTTDIAARYCGDVLPLIREKLGGEKPPA